MMIPTQWIARTRVLLNASRAIYTPMSLAVVAYLLLGEREHFLNSLSSLRPLTLGFIFSMIAAGHFFIGASSYFFFLAIGRRPGFRFVLHTHVNRLPARYLPGGIWQTVSRAQDFSAHGHPVGAVVQLVVLEIGLAVCITASLGSVLLLVSGSEHTAYLAAVACSGAAGILMTPHLHTVINVSEKPLALPAYAAAVTSFAVVSLLYGVAFYIYVVDVLPAVSLPEASGVFLLSWLTGFLAFFAPQGIGVFEVTAGFLLTGAVTTHIVALMFGFRAVSIMSDLALWLASELWRIARGWRPLRNE